MNWNGWRDTLACVDSMTAMPGPPFDLLVFDNGSTDGSVAHLLRWARGRFKIAGESEARFGEGTLFQLDLQANGLPFRSLRLLAWPRNTGYAGALNRSMDWGAQALKPDWFWLLNNDVAMEPGTLEKLLSAAASDPRVGLCGSVLMAWDDPGRYQAVAGRFNWWFATGRALRSLPADAHEVTNLYLGADFPVGASMLVSKAYLADVGPMDESFFLYYEEIDWSERGRRRGWLPGIALQSRLRHKEGASTGSGNPQGPSRVAEYYGLTNRLRIIRKFRPRRVLFVRASLLVVAARRALRGQWRNAAYVLRLMVYPGPPP